jgi:outer membrane protein TolC
MIKRSLAVVLFSCFSFPGFSQSEILDWSTYLNWIGQHHPVTKQAQLTADIGRASVLSARGLFDPVAFASINEKQYNEISYYNRQVAGVDIPTHGGVSFHGTMERNSGVYLNPEKTVPDAGLFSTGVRLNLGQGLLIDQRRRALWQAKAFRQQTLEEQKIQLNNLYLQAAAAYWQWSAAYANFLALERGLAVSMERFEGVRSSFYVGELPAIDTVEAYAQMQNILFRLREQENNLYALRQQVETFLWNEEGMPMEINENVFPQPLDTELNNFNASLADLEEHPNLLSIDRQIDILNIERRWKAEQLRPVLFVQYNLLTQEFGNFEGHGFFENNYSLGGGFIFPLFLRKERGDLRIAKAQLEQTSLERDFTQVRLRNQFKAELNSLRIVQDQVNIFTDNVKNLRLLLEGEQKRFDIGESSIFLINARETTLIDGILTLNRTRSQEKINEAKVRHAAGSAWQVFFN